MSTNRSIRLLYVFILIGLANIFFSSCSQETLNGKIIITRTAAKLENINLVSGDSWQYIPKTQIAVIDSVNGAESVKIITEDFFSAQSPSISYDGSHMLFAAQRKENDHWQIWEMDLGNFKVRQMTFSDQNCTDPDYLPNGTFVFSKLNADDSLKAGHSLYTSKPDGSDIKRITFNPETYFASNVLKDGRILTIGRQVFPKNGEQELTIMLPDGTKADLFYKGIQGSFLLTKGREYSDGKILFIESATGKKGGGNLVSINYNRPLHTRNDLTPGLDGDFRSVAPGFGGKLLVSFRNSDSEKYSIYEFDPKNKALGKKVYGDKDFEVIDAFVVEAKQRPKKLPSEVNLESKTALLLCQDINFGNRSDSFSGKKASKVEILGLNSSLGIVQAEEDGSIYLKIVADQPFQIQTLDDEGNVVNGPCNWIWLRPNERRGCIGCHEDQELVPENKVPMAVKKPPIIIGVQSDNFKNKNY